MNAIILAAGLGSRLKDITQKTHKALLKVFDEPNIERTIKFLKEINVDEIYVVTGYKAEDFLYLESKFGVKLILLSVPPNSSIISSLTIFITC